MLAAVVCGVAVSLYAAGTAAFEVTRLSGGGLSRLSLLTGVAWPLFAGAAALLWARHRRGGARPAGTPEALGLAVLVVTGSALAVSAFRPDTDDGYYVPNVTYAAAHPDAAFDDVMRGLATAPLEPFRSSHWAMPQAYDYLPATVARWTGLHPLDARYLWLPGLAGALLVAAAFLLLRRVLDEDRDALLAALAILVLYALWRDADYAPGNYALGRLYQGKGVVMTALAPLFAASVWGFLRRPTVGTAVVLAGLSLAGAGMTASTLLLFGGVGIGVTAAAWAERPEGGASRIPGRAALAALACVPLALVLVPVLADPLSSGDPGNPINQGVPGTVLGNAGLLGTATWVLLPVLAGCVLWLDRGDSRRAVLAWTAVTVLLFLNPLVGQPILERVVGPAVYWRLFYTLPWVPLAGLAAVRVLERVPAPFAGSRAVALAGGLVLAVLAGGSAFDYGEPRWPPQWDLPGRLVVEAEAVIRQSPPGPMLAPRRIAWLVPILDADHPQLRLRGDALDALAWRTGATDLPERRRLATRALDRGPAPEGPVVAARLEALARVLHESRPVTVVVDREATPGPATADALSAAGYVHAAVTRQFAVWVLSGTSGAPATPEPGGEMDSSE